MPKHHPPLLIALGTLLFAPAQAQTTEAPVEGKVYLINRNTNKSAYIYEASSGLAAGVADNTHKQYWRFIPTGEADRYYVQNVTSGLYIQSTNLPMQNGATQQIQVGRDKVTLEVKANTASGAGALAGYYICSTDQTINPQADNTLGLNYEQATGRIVAYSIRYNRGNSYWELHETDYDYAAPQPDVRSDYSKQLGVYNLPCGSTGNAYIAQVDLEGSGVTDELHFSQTARPSAAYQLERNDRATVLPGGEATIAFKASGMGEYDVVTAYFDWDGDGIFEGTHPFAHTTDGQYTFTVPADARQRTSRIRLRLTDNGMTEAEEDVHGYCHDFFVSVKEGEANERTLTIESCDSTRGRVAFAATTGESTAAGTAVTAHTFSRGTETTILATTRGNAKFTGWECDGKVVSTSAEWTLPVTQSVTLRALFTPNTDKTVDGIASHIVTTDRTGNDAYNVKGLRVDLRKHHGVYVQGGRKKIKK